MNRQPLLIALLGFIFGILWVDSIAMSRFVAYFILLFSIVCLLLSLGKSVIFKRIKPYAFAFFFMSMGMLLHQFNSEKSKPVPFNNRENIVFQIEKKLNSNEKYKRYEVEVLKVGSRKNQSPFKAVMSVSKEVQSLDFTHYYTADAFIKEIETPKFDFLFDYAKYLSRQGIYHQVWIGDRLEASPKPLSFSDQIKQFRRSLLTKISESNLSPKTKEFTKGIILADRTEMDGDTVADFTRTGLVHILAISGTHMVVIFWLVFFVLKMLLPLSQKKLAIVLSLVFIWAFTVLIDFGSSVVRSSIMITAYYIFILLDRKPDLLHAVSLAGFMLLFNNTNSLFDVGFQLSFIAVLGIFWLNKPIVLQFPKPKNEIQKFMISLFAVSLSAQLATLPLVLFYFHQYSALSLVANLLIVPFSEILIVFSLLMTLLFGLGVQLEFLIKIFDFLVLKLLDVIHFFSVKDWAFQENISMSLVEVLLLMVILFLLKPILEKKSSKQMIKISCLIILFLGFRWTLDFYFLEKNEVLTLKNRKKNILIVKENKKIFFYVHPEMDRRQLEKYIIQPYLSSRRMKDYEVGLLPSEVSNVLINGKLYPLD